MDFDYENTETASPAIQTYIKERLIPPVQSYFEAALKIIRLTSWIDVPSSWECGSVTIPLIHAKDGFEADIAIFVSTFDDPSSSSLADARPCTIDKITKRPTIGIIRFNTAKIQPNTDDIAFEMDLSITLHEMTHALGFSQGMFSFYINPDTLEPLTGHVLNKMVNGVEIKVLNLLPLTQRLRAYFNCSTLEGAYLENQGGGGSASSHFERRIFYNEFMTASKIRDARISEFTLAVLEGTGWYKPDYSFAEPMTYGKNAGCAFLDTECINRETLEPNFKEFCSPLKSDGISWTKRGFGYCGNTHDETMESLIDEFDYWGNKTVVVDPFADNCPMMHLFDNHDCENIKIINEAFLPSHEFYGIGSKSFMGTLSTLSGPFASPQGYCFESKCNKKDDDDGGYELQVLFGKQGNNVTCSKKGNIDASKFNFTHNLTGSLQCPDPNEFCEQILSEGSCKARCFGNGECVANECHCKDGWTSYNCAKREMVNECKRCRSFGSLKTTCYGNECICDPSDRTCQVIDDYFSIGRRGVFILVAVGIMMFLSCCFWMRTKRRKTVVEESLENPMMLDDQNDDETIISSKSKASGIL